MNISSSNIFLNILLAESFHPNCLVAFNRIKHCLIHLQPQTRNPCVKHAVQRVAQILTHDDSSINSQFEVTQGQAHHADDALHAVDLLPQKDVHRRQRSHLLEPKQEKYNKYIHIEPFTVIWFAYLNKCIVEILIIFYNLS